MQSLQARNHLQERLAAVKKFSGMAEAYSSTSSMAALRFQGFGRRLRNRSIAFDRDEEKCATACNRATPSLWRATSTIIRQADPKSSPRDARKFGWVVSDVAPASGVPRSFQERGSDSRFASIHEEREAQGGRRPAGRAILSPRVSPGRIHPVRPTPSHRGADLPLRSRRGPLKRL